MSEPIINLFPFQEDAADALREAALRWAQQVAKESPLRYGKQVIPFMGQLRAVTGSGKTPILASALNGIGDAVVIWTSKSSAVVDQTMTNLRGKYHAMLPSGTQIVREMPNQASWRKLIESQTGLTIWLLTTASWNDLDSSNSGGSASARLNLHRPQLDWAGESSPWHQLKSNLKRPLWIVSDESHNQTGAQLHQLAELKPMGFFMASATPVINDLFSEWQRVVDRESEWCKLAHAGIVRVRTRDVVDACLLKTTLELIDFKSGTEESLDGTLAAFNELGKAVKEEGAFLSPKAIYVVEQSNPKRGSTDESRPVVIWKYLRSKGVDANEIAIFTDTKDLPREAERVTSLDRLQVRHKHIIFNQSLQEGWDDPEAYVCYFDGITNSFLRIRQIMGRVLRQPLARRFKNERLNTATLVLNTASETYQSVVAEIRAELRLYSPEDEPHQVVVKLKTRADPLQPIPPKGEHIKLSLPRLSIKAPDLTAAVKKIQSRGQSPWAEEFLLAPGVGVRSFVLLAAEDRERTESFNVIRSARTQNGAYLKRRIRRRNRDCLNAIHPDRIVGPAYDQNSCQGSGAQSDLDDLAGVIVDSFESRVEYEEDPDPDMSIWVVGDYRPRGKALVEFNNAVHEAYSESDFNADERLLANELDSDGRGTWLRNQPTPNVGFGIPLPMKVGESKSFYPDFLWWVDNVCWAIDPTGRHLLEEKIRGKLISLNHPKIAMLARGKINIKTGTQEDSSGWTLVIARASLSPLVEYVADLKQAISIIAPRQTPS